MKKYLILLVVLFISFSAYARKVEPKENTKETVKNVKVNGMVCSFCSTSLERKFSKQKEVSSINVDLEKKNVAVFFKPGETLPDEKIKKMIKGAGYDVVSIAGGDGAVDKASTGKVSSGDKTSNSKRVNKL